GFAIGGIAFGDRAFLDMTARAFAQSLDVSQKWFVSHSVTPCPLYFSEGSDDITRSKCCEQVSHVNKTSVSRHDREGLQRSVIPTDPARESLENKRKEGHRQLAR